MARDLALGVVPLWHSITAFINRLRRGNRLQREFYALDHDEAERLLRECAMGRSDFLASLRNPLCAEDLLLPAMRSAGLDPEAHKARHPAWHRDIERTCTACENRRRCRRDVLNNRFAARHRSYCPNRDSFAEIAQTSEDS
ncbi:hypothetical protein EET67_24730 [Pseudaminobacter arsenicus]|uniref:Uncharacterized protein n=1 Tax=Borborobacter arsenicus TaxID=1851146 RepID=A0A432UZ18_9HYPH|nr:hypothetical protein [Pseudaminobacter arsenicus]RUM95176.1 hypothetical protein EET67_24730 [Pseudaminobacter arsenicus]